MTAIYRKEIKAYFSSPIAYIYLAIFYLVSGLFFYLGSLSMGLANLNDVFSMLFALSLIAVPFLTMRLFAEEKKQRTDQVLLTAPISLNGIVVGKFLAALSIFAIGISVTLVYAFVLTIFAPIEWAIIIGNLLGILLLGAAFIAMGTFVSCLTENQIIAAVVTIAISLFWVLMDSLAGIFNIGFITSIINSLSLYTHYYNFTVGLLNIASILFFVSAVAVFLFLTTRLLERRRWS